MSRISTIAKATPLFGVIGAIIGALVYYTLEYWGSHSAMLLALFDPKAAKLALLAMASNLQLAFVFALPASFVAGLALSGLLSLASPHLTHWHALTIAAMGMSVSGLASMVLYGVQFDPSSPFVVSAISGFVTALLLSRPMRRWFSPRAPAAILQR